MEKIEMMKTKKGFIAALDQSGGSSAKTLKLYGIDESSYNGDEEMFNLIHEMRTRIMTSKSFTSEKIVGVILFEQTMNRKIEGKYTSEYLWDKGILSFLKIDKGLADLAQGVQVMKDIPGLDDTLKLAVERGIFGTKMRSLIKEANEVGIKNVVDQQFDLAKKICSYGLVPIIEPEVSITSPNKLECEKILKENVKKHLSELGPDEKVMFKFTIPSEDNFYLDIIEDPHVVKVVALSGGYEKHDACVRLSHNKDMIASFSRALLEGLNVNDTEEEFDKKLSDAIDEIYTASVEKV